MATCEFSASALPLKRFVVRLDAWSDEAIASRLSRVASYGSSALRVPAVRGHHFPLLKWYRKD